MKAPRKRTRTKPTNAVPDAAKAPGILEYRGMTFREDHDRGMPMSDAFHAADVLIRNDLPVKSVIFLVNEHPIPADARD